MRPFKLRFRNSGVRVAPASTSRSVQSYAEAKVRQQQADFVAVAGIQVVEEVHAVVPAESQRTLVCAATGPHAIEKACALRLSYS